MVVERPRELQARADIGGELSGGLLVGLFGGRVRGRVVENNLELLACERGVDRGENVRRREVVETDRQRVLCRVRNVLR